MDIRQLEYLATLARERHFTRAAAACNVTQPTLSVRIRQLERELGVQIVQRGQRFHGLTPAGEQVLRWSQIILDNVSAMTQAVSRLKGGMVGRLALGVVPSALPVAAVLTSGLRKRHPEVTFDVLSQGSDELLRALQTSGIDAAITYLDQGLPDALVTRPLYNERYCLFVRQNHPLAGRSAVSWAEAAGQPLCLLTPNMQNRSIIDAAFRQADCAPSPEIQTNAILGLSMQIELGGMASVLPEFFLELMGGAERFAAIPLNEPSVEHRVGLIALRRDPPSPLIEALFDQRQDLEAAIQRQAEEIAPQS